MSTGGGVAQRMISVIELVLRLVVALILFGMMALTVVDVGGRYFFNRPLLGAFEVTEVLLGIMVFCGLPLVSISREHITVDLLDTAVPAALRNLRDGIISLVCAGAMAFIAAHLWTKAADAAEYGDSTATLLLPLAPVMYLMSVMCGITALILVLLGIAEFFSPRKPSDQGSTLGAT
ncbi:TRAP transporter small permease [Arenibaculum pallidiluteum]|uniref:TRAP transporter small permease n=1 Tax=Arenibaculum pallidiluteum TaxID=2812559 RepID=UPI001A95EF27|nr:TRAP transporter small permease [Arenibaculum pallidiluteum]